VTMFGSERTMLPFRVVRNVVVSSFINFLTHLFSYKNDYFDTLKLKRKKKERYNNEKKNYENF